MGDVPFKPMSRKAKAEILKQIDRTLDELDETVVKVKEWVKKQKHFPEEPSDTMIEFFIVLCRFDMDLIPEKLDSYYTIRSSIPDIYERSNPSSKSMQDTLDYCQIFPLPKYKNGSECLVIVHLKNAFVPENFNSNSWMAAIMNIIEILMQQDLFLECSVIYDHENLSLAHVLQITPKFVINGATILEKTFCNRVRHIHVINYPAIFQIVLTVAKPLIKTELYEKFRLHANLEDFAKDIPLDILPEKYGGTEKSLDELEDLWRQKMKEYQDRFDKLEFLRVDESLREIPLEQNGLIESFTKMLFGM